MTQEVFQGRVVFGAPAAAGGTWRGLSLLSTVNTPCGSGAVPVEFDVVEADTDSIYNGTDGGIVPVGMAGRWSFGGYVYLSSSGLPDTHPANALLSLNSLATFWQNQHHIEATVHTIGFGFPPLVKTLAEGDEIQIYAGTGATTDAEARGQDCYFLMEYLGPVVAPGS